MATNKLYLGSGKPNKIYLGETEISRVYLGDTMVYDTSSNYIFESSITQITFPSIVSSGSMENIGKSVTITSTKDDVDIEFEFSTVGNWITAFTNLLYPNQLTIRCNGNNLGLYDRIGSVFLKQPESNKEIFINISQLGGGLISDTALSPTSLSFSYADLSKKILLYSPVDASVHFSNVPSWINLKKLEPYGEQVWMNGQIQVSVDYNGSSNPRAGIPNILINNTNYEITVTQACWVGEVG